MKLKITVFLFFITGLLFSQSDCWLKISAGEEHILAIKTDGTLWGWGSNDFSKVGTDSGAVNITTPTQIGSDNDWKEIAAGVDHSLAIKNDGTLWAWGYGANGRLGTGNTNNSNVPVQIGTANNWSKISAGSDHSAAIKTNGTLWAWGRNAYGQLGDGTTVSKSIPIQIGTDTNWKEISIGIQYSIAVKTNGYLYGWGLNSASQLGGSFPQYTNYSPVIIATGSDWSNVFAKYLHSMALKNTNTLWGWGSNSNGQIGLGDTSTKTFPHAVSGATWKSASVGASFTLGVKSDGTLWAWGYNAYGQIGNGVFGTVGNNNVVYPNQIGTATNWSKVSAGYSFGAALKSNGELWMWGRNNRYQLGDGTSVNKNQPIQVNCPTSLSIAESLAEQSIINFYPNPFDDFIEILSDKSLIKEIQLYDILGRSQVYLKPNSEQQLINTTKLQSGVYFLKIKTDKETETFKILKK